MLGNAPHQPSPLSQREQVLLLALLAVGAFLLLFRFPAVPVGLHQDEMSEAYESLALLRTGADRWGYHLPVYFLSWGSGQNVLQAYLNIPIVAVLGLSRLGARLLPMLLNLLALPFFFLAVRRWYGNRAALLALAFLVLSPWHIMLSRFGIENSPLPFFLALGLFTFGAAISKPSAWRVVPVFVPFALAMYTYGITIVTLPLFIPLLLWLELPTVRRTFRLWLSALALLALLVSPLIFFTAKNYVFKRNFAFERHLPFTVPLLPRSRLEEATVELKASSVLHHNIKFFALRMPDNRHDFMQIWPWYQLPDVHSVQNVLFPLFLLGLGVAIWRGVRARRPVEPFVLLLLACAVVVEQVSLNTSRAGVFYLPILALASYGFFFLLERLRSPLARALAWAVLGCLTLGPMVHFVREYYGSRYAQEIAESFYPHMPEALAAAHRLAGPNRPIVMSRYILLNYVDVLFLERVDPVFFQHTGASWHDPDFGQFHFQLIPGDLATPSSVFIVPQWQLHRWMDIDRFCAHPEAVSRFDELTVGYCR